MRALVVSTILIITACSFREEERFVRVASYNVENLFDLRSSGYEYDLYIPGKCGWNPVTFDTKLENLSRVISHIDPDIIVLNELENEVALKHLKSMTAVKGTNLKYHICGPFQEGTTTSGILSAFPVVDTSIYRVSAESDPVLRSIIEADIDIAGDTLKVFAMHLPSKRHKEAVRIKAGSIIKERLRKLDRETDYIICGDLNSNCNEAETIFTAEPDNATGFTLINHTLGTALSPPGSVFVPVMKSDICVPDKGLCHFNPWFEIDPEYRFSYIYKGHLNTLDHILLPHSMFDTAGFSYVDNSFRTERMYGELIHNNKPYRWQIDFKGRPHMHLGKGFSDHLPIVLELERGGYRNRGDRKGGGRSRTESKKRLNKDLPDRDADQQGWVSGSRYYRVCPTGEEACKGSYSLRIKGDSKGGESACFAVYPNGLEEFALSMKGRGEIAVIIRSANGSMICFCGDDFSRSLRAVRYTSFSSKDWRRFSFTGFPDEEEWRKVVIRCRGSTEIYIDAITPGVFTR
ncbi:MAG: endonuclease/exonuclease/phosphatase family protein [Chitinivibrionales bacterium]